MMTGDELGTAMRMAWGTETSTGRTVRDADGADFTLLSEAGYGHSATTRFSKSCCNSTGKNTHYFHCSLTSKSCMTCKTDFLTQLMEKEFLPVFLLCKNVSCAIYWLQAMLHSLQEHNAVLLLPFVPKPPSQTQGKSQTSSTGSQVATVTGIHLAPFSYSLHFKVRVSSLWLLLWDNLKMYFPYLPWVRTFPASVESSLVEEEGDAPGFPLLPLEFLSVWATEGFAGEQRCSFFFNFTRWIFIRWWLLPQRSARRIKTVCSQLSATDRAPNLCKVGLFLPSEVTTSGCDFPRHSPVLRADACQTSPR